MVIQRLLGHASISTTRVYPEIGDQTLRRVYHRAQRHEAQHAGAQTSLLEHETPAVFCSRVEFPVTALDVLGPRP